MPRILVADGNSNIQRTVATALKDAGIDVVAVGNGEAAVRKIAEIAPELVLADIFMPVRSGYEVCEFVKNDSRYKHTPVVLLVGAFDPLDDREAQRVGADGVLKKPFVPPDPLINMVKALLAKSTSEHLVPVGVPASSAAAVVRTADAPVRESHFTPPTDKAVNRTAAERPSTDEASTVVTASRDPILGDPGFWSAPIDTEDPEQTSVEEMIEGHSWGKADEDSDDPAGAHHALPMVDVPEPKDHATAIQPTHVEPSLEVVSEYPDGDEAVSGDAYPELKNALREFAPLPTSPALPPRQWGAEEETTAEPVHDIAGLGIRPAAAEPNEPPAELEPADAVVPLSAEPVHEAPGRIEGWPSEAVSVANQTPEAPQSTPEQIEQFESAFEPMPAATEQAPETDRDSSEEWREWLAAPASIEAEAPKSDPGRQWLESTSAPPPVAEERSEAVIDEEPGGPAAIELEAIGTSAEQMPAGRLSDWLPSSAPVSISAEALKPPVPEESAPSEAAIPNPAEVASSTSASDEYHADVSWTPSIAPPYWPAPAETALASPSEHNNAGADDLPRSDFHQETDFPAIVVPPIGELGADRNELGQGQRDKLDPEMIDAIVTRAMERMQPQLLDLVNREVLRPVVEALIRREIEKR